MTIRKLISKSAYLIFKQCPKYLWYYINERDSIPEPGPDTQFYFRIGHIIGQLAKLCFPEGIEIGHEGEFEKNLTRTRRMIKEGKPLFEAGFLYNDARCDLYSRADILLPVEKKRDRDWVWDVVEVKSSTGIKDINLFDLAFQKYCYTKAGLDIRNCNLMYINNQYYRQDGIDVKKLFTITDVTETINKICLHIKHDIKQIVSIINSDEPPEIAVGKLCDSPYTCPLKDKCWEGVSNRSIFYLNALTKKTARRLKECGIDTIDDIPDDFTGLSYRQKRQIDCEKNSEIYINKKAISQYLEKLEYPLYFLDFETFSSPIPLIENTRPYQNIPFQFSLHVLKDHKDNLGHYSFLASGDIDPREDVLKKLKEYIGPEGSIVVYNASFEKAVLRELAINYPGYEGWISSIIERVVDLYEPFRNFDYYHIDQKGSASVKKVLPALTGISYDDMEISNGGMASACFLENSGLWRNYISHNGLDRFIRDNRNTYISVEELNRKRDYLERYCKLDTEGMVHIIQALEKNIQDESKQDKN
jgi:hypothetical protein